MAGKDNAKKIPVNGIKASGKQSETNDSVNPDAQEDQVSQDAAAQKDAADPMQEMADTLEMLKKESAENYDRFLRANAELENYKKRSMREMTEFKKFANEQLVRDMLPVVDDLERAVSHANDDSDSCKQVIDGLHLTLGEIKKVLKRYNVMQINALCEPFDPNFHQAMLQEESDGHPENTVIKEFQKGYLMNDRLLRPAMVVVSKPPADKKKTEDA